MAKLGFTGLGIMGKPMAGHLLKAGHTVNVYDLNPAPVKELAGKGAVACKSSKEVAEASDIIIIMVPDTPDVEAVLFGKSGVAEGLKAGKIVVDMSSISPVSTKEFAKKLAGMGVKMLDAPVSGGETGAVNAALSIMVGGEPDVFEKIKPIFELLGKKILLIGGNGDGQTCKVANQIAVAVTILATSEALLFAAKAGADPRKVREALMGGLASSTILDRLGGWMLDHKFDPGFRIKLHQKDLSLAISGARSLSMALPGTVICAELFNAVAAEAGGENLDHSAMVTALEKLANFKLKK